jgi:hypothetical protein
LHEDRQEGLDIIMSMTNAQIQKLVAKTIATKQYEEAQDSWQAQWAAVERGELTWEEYVLIPSEEVLTLLKTPKGLSPLDSPEFHGHYRERI